MNNDCRLDDIMRQEITGAEFKAAIAELRPLPMDYRCIYSSLRLSACRWALPNIHDIQKVIPNIRMTREGGLTIGSSPGTYKGRRTNCKRYDRFQIGQSK